MDLFCFPMLDARGREWPAEALAAKEKRCGMNNLSNIDRASAPIRSAGHLRGSKPKPEFGRPVELNICLIDEDPGQPRSEANPGFHLASLKEMAATIELRGVKSPISVRNNRQAPGRYIINHGARRFRASKMAGMETIPAFVDDNYIDADQVIENLQRNELTPREIADFIGRELAKGQKKNQIAKSIGKSAAFVTQHVTLLDLPSPIAEAFSSGRVRDVTVVNELVTCFKSSPDDVKMWLCDERQEVTRSSVKLLREFAEEKAAGGYQLLNNRGVQAECGPPDSSAGQDAPPASRLVDGRIKFPVLRLTYHGRLAELLLHRQPTKEGRAWIRYEDGAVSEVALSGLRLISLADR